MFGLVITHTAVCNYFVRLLVC